MIETDTRRDQISSTSNHFLGNRSRAVEEMLRQTEEDADKEILELKTRYEKGTESTEQRLLNSGQPIFLESFQEELHFRDFYYVALM